MERMAMARGDSASKNMPENIVTHILYIPANHHYKSHKHDYHELVVIQQGRFRVSLPDGVHIAIPGDILFYPAGVLHEEWAENKNPVVTWICAFRWDGFGPEDTLVCQDMYGRVEKLIAKLSWEFYRVISHSPLAKSPEYRLKLLQKIIDELKRFTIHGERRILERIRTFIIEHMSEPFTLDDLVTVSGLSKSYFVRHYRRMTGRTPMEHVRQLRLEEAKRLLQSTKMPLYEIGPQVGIPDAHHLSRLLKIHLNVSARDLRSGQ